MITLAISGAGGNLAGPIITAADAADDIDVVALYNPNRAGGTVGSHPVIGDRGDVRADVILETAHPDVVFDNLEAWRDQGKAAVVGTSGFTAERLERLGELWGRSTPCLVVPNFAIGAVLMMKFAREAAARFEAVEIVERHHASKPDAPSGTSLATAMGIGAAGGASIDLSTELVPGARGAEVESVRIHSVRLPGLIAQQEVAFSNPGEVLTIEHLTTSYESFAAGALHAVRHVGDLDGGVHLGLEMVLQ